MTLSAVGVKRCYAEEGLDACVPPSKKQKNWQYDAPLPALRLRKRTVYKQISEQEIYGRLRSLFYECLKPKMLAQGQNIIKLSRHDYSFLDASHFITADGMFFKQVHKTCLHRVDGPKAQASTISPLLDRGFFKDVFILDPLPGFPPMVRAVYRLESNIPELGDAKMRAISRRYFDHPNLLVGYYLVYRSSKTGKVKRCYIMTRMDIPFSKFRDVVSFSSAISLTVQLARGIQVLIHNGWSIPDLHYGNILIRRAPELSGGYLLGIIDFDLMEQDKSSVAQRLMINDIGLFYQHLKVKKPIGEKEARIRVAIKKLFNIDNPDVDAVVDELEEYAANLNVYIPRWSPPEQCELRSPQSLGKN